MMRKPPWHTLSLLSGAKGVKADWHDFPERLLKPTNELAKAFPCPKGRGCYMDVITHKDGTHVGLCPDAPNGCDKRILEKTDLIIYQPDLNAIFSAIGLSFGITGITQTKIDGLTLCWQIGEYNPAASHRFSVIASFEGKASKVERTIGLLATRLQKPFFFLLPAASTITAAVQDIASKNRAKLLAFEDIVEVSNKGEIQSCAGTEDVIRESSTGWLPAKDSAFSYPTPAGAEWGGFVFEFTADEMVTVSYQKSSFKPMTPEDFGMRDRRNKMKTTKAWTFLKSLAATNGRMPVTNMDDVKKTKQDVSKVLKRIFQMKADPIEWVQENAQYETKFVIRKATNAKLSFERFSGLE